MVVPLLLTMPASVVVDAFPTMVQFLMVSEVAPLDTDALAIQMTADDVPVLVFVIVRLLPPVFIPSMVTKSAPLSLKIADELPEIEAATPVVGLIVSPLPAPAP